MIQKVGMNQGRYWETAPKQKPKSSNFLELFQAEQAKGVTARQYLSTLTPEQLATLQKASRLAAPIDIAVNQMGNWCFERIFAKHSS